MTCRDATSHKGEQEWGGGFIQYNIQRHTVGVNEINQHQLDKTEIKKWRELAR